MADHRLPLTNNMEPQAEESRMEGEESRMESANKTTRVSDQDQGAAGSSSSTGATRDTANTDAQDGEADGGARWDGKEEEDDEYYDDDDYYPYPGVLALAEIGIRDSREMIHTALGLVSTVCL